MRNSGYYLGLLIVGVLIVITEGFNAAYGYSLGRTVLECAGIAAASASIGLFKVYTPFIIGRAWSARDYVRTSAALVALFGALAVGHFSTIGVLAERKLDRAAERATVTESKEALLEQIEAAKEQLKASPIVRDVSVARAEYHKVERDLSLKWSDRTKQLNALEVEIAQAEAHDKLQAKLDSLRARVEGRVSLVGDAQAETLTTFYGGNTRNWQYATILITALVLDAVSTLGMWLISNLRDPLPASPARASDTPEEAKREDDEEKPGNVVAFPGLGGKILANPNIKQVSTFVAECLEEDPTGEIGAAEMHDAYCEWARARKETCLSRNIFGTVLGYMIEKDLNGFSNRRYVGVRFAEGRQRAGMHPDPPAQLRVRVVA